MVLHKPDGVSNEMETLNMNTTIDRGDNDGGEKIFTFDHAYDETSSQLEVYQECAKGIV